MPLEMNHKELEEAVKRVIEIVNTTIKTQDTLIDDLRTNIELLKANSIALKLAMETYIKPLENFITGVSKSENSDEPRGAGAGDVVDDNIGDINRITQKIDGNMIIVSVPHHIFERIQAHQNDIEELIIWFDEYIKKWPGNKDAFNFYANNTIAAIASLIDVTFDEAEIIFKASLATYLHK